MEINDQIQVEVVYALPQRSWTVPVTLVAGSTLLQAVTASGILQQCPEINLAKNRVGIYGKIRTPDTVLRTGDRIEIYRSLNVDPKEARRRRAVDSGI